MSAYTKQLAVVAVAILVLSSNAFANGTDSTKIGKQKVKHVLGQKYLLDQGTLSTMKTPFPYNVQHVQVTNKRCGRGAIPSFITSIQSTYQNATYHIGGIFNNLTMDAKYQANGSLYMENFGAVGGNTRSPVTVAWQVWCQPVA